MASVLAVGIDSAVDEPLPGLGGVLKLYGRIAAHLEGPPVGDHNRVSDAVHEAAVAHGGRGPTMPDGDGGCQRLVVRDPALLPLRRPDGATTEWNTRLS